MTYIITTATTSSRRRVLRDAKSPSTADEAVVPTTRYATTDYDETIEDGLELREAIERYRGVSSQEFTRLDDFFERFGD